jgi:glycosyltransferase involved in cell wall biosynthesis
VVRNSVAKLATALLLYSPAVARRLVDQGWPAERVFVAINSLDQAPINAARDEWLHSEDRLEVFRRQHQLYGQPTMLYVSRLHSENRLDMAIQALDRLRIAHPTLELVVIGNGDEERARLEQLARQLGVQKRVRFVGAIYDEPALAPWFLSASVFCYPANVGLSLLHAFGYGLPVVTTNRVAAQNPEIEALSHGVNGLLYQDGSVDSLAEAISTVISDQALAQRMGQAARETVVQTFSLEKMVDGIVAATTYCCRRKERVGV